MVLKGIKHSLYTWCTSERQKHTGIFPSFTEFVNGYEDLGYNFKSWKKHIAGIWSKKSFFEDLNWHKQEIDDLTTAYCDN